MSTSVQMDPSSRTRTWQEEAEMLLSLLDCLILTREAVYASSEFTTGRRFYQLCRDHNVRTAAELKHRLGADFGRLLLGPNKEEGIRFALKLRESGLNFVLTPNPFDAAPLTRNQNWKQSEYLNFWERVIHDKCSAVYFNEGWQFSNGCTFEYLTGRRAGLPLFDHARNPLEMDRAKQLIGDAIAGLNKEGFDTPELRKVYEQLTAS